MPECRQYKCQEIVNDDALDHECFFCHETFCLDHIDDYPAGTIKSARRRIDDIKSMNIDEEYLNNLIEELEIAEETYEDEDEIIIFSHIMFPICSCCAEKLAEKSVEWKGIIEKVT